MHRAARRCQDRERVASRLAWGEDAMLEIAARYGEITARYSEITARYSEIQRDRLHIPKPMGNSVIQLFSAMLLQGCCRAARKLPDTAR